MTFGEKLDFLMNITKTSNSALGQQVKLDASYISRLRNGQRSALKDISCIEVMAAYFARNCVADYQCKALAEMLKMGTKTTNNPELFDLIAAWLLDEKKEEATAIGNFLDGFSNPNSKRVKPDKPQQNDSADEFPQEDISIYYGLAGKRQASGYFLSEVIAQGKPQTLLLFSDEETDWVTEDRAFEAKWATMMVQLLSQGNRIKIIHTVSRNLDEMLKAIHQWMPLYMTGLIEPYYCPKIRDGVFKRTLFILPDVTAVVSNSLGSSINNAANFLIRDKDAIMSFVEEFNQYLRLCKPLMTIYSEKEKKLYFSTLLKFEYRKVNTIIRTESISIVTMPEALILSIIDRICVNKTDLMVLQEYRQRLFEANLENNSYTEIIQLSDFEQIKNEKIKIAFSEMLLGATAYYTFEEYILHIENLIYLLGKYENFHLHIISKEPEIQYMVYSREEHGTIVAKTSAPPLVLAVNETNLATAFWDYLRTIIGEKAFQNPNNIQAAKRLTDYIQQIKKYCIV